MLIISSDLKVNEWKVQSLYSYYNFPYDTITALQHILMSLGAAVEQKIRALAPQAESWVFESHP